MDATLDQILSRLFELAVDNQRLRGENEELKRFRSPANGKKDEAVSLEELEKAAMEARVTK